MMRFLLAALLAGCAGETEYTPHPSGGEESAEGSNNQDTGLTTTTDADGDGWTVEDGDCDDQDLNVYPGAEEIFYDGVVYNCDLLVNNPFPEGYEWLVDYDYDGDMDVYAVHDRPEGIYLDPDDEDPDIGHEDGHYGGNSDDDHLRDDTG